MLLNERVKKNKSNKLISTAVVSTSPYHLASHRWPIFRLLRRSPPNASTCDAASNDFTTENDLRSSSIEINTMPLVGRDTADGAVFIKRLPSSAPA